MASTKTRQPRAKTLPELLAAARGDRSYRQAAAELGISPPLYKQWEEDFTKPNVNKAYAIARFCGVHYADVLVLMGVLTPKAGDVLRTGDSSQMGWSAPLHDLGDAMPPSVGTVGSPVLVPA